MKTIQTKQLLKAASCLLCAAMALKYCLDLGGTEFGSGRLTSTLLTLHICGSILFVLALVLTFMFPRVAAATALTAALFCLPLYLYFIAPGPFQHMFPGLYSVPTRSYFVWNGWAISGVLTLAVMAYVTLTFRNSILQHR